MPGISYRKWVLMGTAGLAVVLAGGAAHAEPETQLSEIAVSAGGEQTAETGDAFVAEKSASSAKTSRPLIKTPQAVSVVTRAQFEQQGATTAAEALRYTPGVQPDARPNDRYDIVPVRGYGGYQNFVQYLDGLRILRGMSFSQPTVDIFDLERIDVVRGPASVLYGQITPGGLVNLVSKKPTETPLHEATLTMGTDNYIKTGIDLSGPVQGSDILFYRLTASGRYNETNLDGVTSERVSISPSLTIKPDEGTSLTLLVNYSNDPSSSYPVYLPAPGVAYANGAYAGVPYDFNVGDPDYDSFTREVTRIGYEFEHDLTGQLTFRQKLRYSHIESEQKGLSGRSISGTTITRLASHVKESADTFVVDNQLEANFATGAADHTVLIGVDYQYVNADRLFGTGAAPTIDYLNPVYGSGIATPAYATDANQVTSQTGIYLQDQIEIGRLNLAIGGRYDSYSVDTDTLTLASATTQNLSQENSAFTGRVGATYLFDSGLAPYASYSTSFEPPSGLGYNAGGGVTLEPVEGEQYEIGVKYQPQGSNMMFGAALFHLVQSNAVSNDPANRGYYIQTGEVTTDGLELEARLGLDSGWDITAAYTFLDAENTGNAEPAYIGNTPVLVPEQTASLWAHYQFRQGRLEGLGVGAGVRYIGSTYGAEDNSFKVDGFTLVDLAMDYDFGARSPDLEGLSLKLSVANLLDEQYVSSCLSTVNCFYGTGRTALATLKYKW